MGLVRRSAHTLRKGVSFLVLFSCFVLLCILHSILARLLSTVLEPFYEGIADFQGDGEVELDSVLDLQVDHRQARMKFWNSSVWFGAGQKSATKYFMDALSAWIIALLGRLLCLESSVNLVGLACLKEEMDISALTLFCEKKMWCLTRMWSCHKIELWSLKWNILNVGNSNNLIMFYFANPMTILVELAEVFQNKGTKQTFSHYLKFPG